MISEQAKSGFDQIFEKALTANVAAEFCEIVAIKDPREIKEGQFSVLTISSPFFKLLTLFHFDCDQDTGSYFVKNAEADDNAACRDAFLEFCNICCGTMNRELHKSFHFLGMSTPYVLLNHSSRFISALEPGYIRHFRITLNASLVLHATLCVCDYGLVDFAMADTSEEEVETGELELF